MKQSVRKNIKEVKNLVNVEFIPFSGTYVTEDGKRKRFGFNVAANVFWRVLDRMDAKMPIVPLGGIIDRGNLREIPWIEVKRFKLFFYEEPVDVVSDI